MSNNHDYRMSVGEFAKLVGRTVSTVQRWDRDGTLTAYRTIGGRRYYTLEHYLQIKRPAAAGKEEVVGYCRVMDERDLEGLDRQRNLITAHCAKRRVLITRWIYDYGNGIDFDRPHISEFFDMIEIGLVKTLVFTHRDRFLLLGFEWFDEFCRKHGVEIIAVCDSEGSKRTENPTSLNDEISSLLLEYRASAGIVETIMEKKMNAL